MRHRGSGRLAQALGLESRFFLCVTLGATFSTTLRPLVLLSAFAPVALGCAGLRVALGSSTWRARKIMRSLLADWRAGTASRYRLVSSNCWLGYVGSGQLCRFQRSRHFRTHGGPNYSLKSDRRGVACGTIIRSRPQRPLSSTVRAHAYHCCCFRCSICRSTSLART